MSLIQKYNFVADDGYSVERFRDEDAPAISQNFRAVYGDHYPSPAVYDPASFITANRTGTRRSFVARDPLGAVVGHLAAVESTPFRGTRELGQGIVLPGHRGAGLLNRLIAHAIADAEADPDCFVLFGASVCNHVFSQRGLSSAGFTEVAFEVDFAPARLFAKEQSAQGRVATLVQYRTLRQAPLPLPTYLPAPYAAEVQALFAQAGDDRRFLRPAPHLPGQPGVPFEVVDLPGFETTRLIVRHAGQDFAAEMEAAERQASAQGRAVVQVTLDLGLPTVGPAVDVLRRQGYWLGGVLPRWFDTDGLLMQKTFAMPDFDGIKTSSPQAHALQDMIEKDWLRTVPAATEVPVANDNAIDAPAAAERRAAGA